jgi:hypothetical protein
MINGGRTNEERLQHLEDIIKGNGEPGLNERVRVIEKFVANQEAMQEQVRKDSKQVKIMIVGAVVASVVVQIILMVLKLK